MRMLIGAAIAMLLLNGPAASAAPDGIIRVGSKSFTESYILAEIAAQVIERVGEARVDRRPGLGGTGITYRAIASEAIDLYPEYTGTLGRIILKDPALRTPEAIRARLRAAGLTISDPLGFNNTYALAVRADTAERLGLRSIGDLARHPELSAAFSSGFLEREDGWPGLTRHYGLSLAKVRVMEHALTYRAMASGEVDVMDVFSTDGQLERLRLRILQDDRRFFPDYSAVLLARRDMAERYPRTWARLREVLEGSLDDARMAKLNAMADLDGKSVAEVAATFLGGTRPDSPRRAGIVAELYTLTLDHLVLVLISLAAAIVLGIPLGIVAARFRRTGQVELGTIGMLQTVPALALLVFMIPLFGIGKGPALVALSLYALLPVVRSTYAGLMGIDGNLLDIAFVLGLGRLKRLVRIELPLASISIMSGIKTAAVMTVGTATLAAFIGGGGYGTLIVRGLALDDTATILAGAGPAAAMAVAFHVAFELLDRLAVPRGLRR
ncbi:MAG TPA: glycine betaine ABC transporter substrate-binding protein [Methylomirabilota bacterium]|jgi:osmoprotectant transport system permease protein|nr:glycine betaine ABC transporter substrate-binding protein [Methylomirabilota bacterium]